MTVDELKKINLQITASSEAFSGDTLNEVASELMFSDQVDPLFLHQANIFVNKVHRIISNTDYYSQVKPDLIKVCGLAKYLAGQIKILQQKNKPYSKSIYADLMTMADLLAKIAPYIRMVSGVIILLNNSDVKFG